MANDIKGCAWPSGLHKFTNGTCERCGDIDGRTDTSQEGRARHTMARTLKIGGKTFVTTTLTDKGQIKPGDILRNHYGEDLIITAVKPYRRNGGGITVSGVMPVGIRWAGEPNDLSYLRFSHDIPFGYDITHNRTDDTAENTDTATDADMANDLGMRG